MYFFVVILIFILLCFLLFFWRSHWASKKVRSLSHSEKQELLDSLLFPFGYYYVANRDFISSHNDAWQRLAGYRSGFDRAALSLHMVFDALPIYFNYRGRTWLIELWKGQYGINCGAEVGIYYADGILTEEELADAHFQAVEDHDRLFLSYTLFRDGTPIASHSGVSWWLTCFLVGLFSAPARLSLEVSIYFRDAEMQYSFLNALHKLPTCAIQFRTHQHEVKLMYAEGCPLSPICPAAISRLRRLRIRWVQVQNAFFCRLYLFMTRRFSLTLDRILYLYYLLPFVLRRMLNRLKGGLQK